MNAPPESQVVTTPTMYCRKCGYVLDGLDEHRCPECGRPFDPGRRRTYRTRPRMRWWLRALLTETRITGAGLAHLGRSSSLAKLDLYRTRITDANLEHFQAPVRLKVLGLRGTEATRDGAAKLEQARPGLIVDGP